MLQVLSSLVLGVENGAFPSRPLKRGNMKKLMAASVLALLVLASSQQSASAWCHCKFGVGLNFEFSSGNNCCLWGAFRNGPTPDGWGPLCGPGGGPVAGPMADWYAPA